MMSLTQFRSCCRDLFLDLAVYFDVFCCWVLWLWTCYWPLLFVITHCIWRIVVFQTVKYVFYIYNITKAQRYVLYQSLFSSLLQEILRNFYLFCNKMSLDCIFLCLVAVHCLLTNKKYPRFQLLFGSGGTVMRFSLAFAWCIIFNTLGFEESRQYFGGSALLETSTLTRYLPQCRRSLNIQLNTKETL